MLEKETNLRDQWGGASIYRRAEKSSLNGFLRSPDVDHAGHLDGGGVLLWWEWQANGLRFIPTTDGRTIDWQFE